MSSDKDIVMSSSGSVNVNDSVSLDPNACDPLFVLRGHHSPVHCLSFHPFIINKHVMKDFDPNKANIDAISKDEINAISENVLDSDSDSDDDITSSGSVDKMLIPVNHSQLVRPLSHASSSIQRGYPPWLISG